MQSLTSGERIIKLFLVCMAFSVIILASPGAQISGGGSSAPGSGRVNALNEPGGAAEPVRYIGAEQADSTHEGCLRLAVGVKSYQAFRANRAHPELADNFGWTYNHAPMLAYWNGKFYVEYLSSPIHENHSPMQTLLITSADGETWDPPKVVFPQYKLPNGKIALVHQRMGFYVAPDGRLLVLGFYGLEPHPNDGTGVGRVVREAHKDGSFGPIYFIRYSSHNGWNEKNTSFPFYAQSSDQGFKDACRSLLENKLVTMPWWEEDRSQDGFYYPMGQALKALSFFHRKDGTVVGLWKSSWTSLSKDEGRTWSKPVKSPTIITAEGKVWGQRTKDGRYALVYNPRADNRHRWPLAIVTGNDGITFDDLLVVNGEVPPRRYNGLDKAFGPQYVRGIVEGNGSPPGNVMWVTYSMNKDDIWVSRIPLPVRSRVERPVHDTFDTGATADLNWNLYCPKWASVRIADFPSAANRSLRIEDGDPCDYSRAVRVFPESKQLTVKFKLLARQANAGRLEIELLDRHGYRPPVRVYLDDQGRISALDGNRNDEVIIARYKAEVWYAFELKIDTEKDRWDLWLDGKPVLENAEMLDPVRSLERISFRTGPYRSEPSLRTPKSPGLDLPNSDDPARQAVYFIDEVEITGR